jgi:hypothetical protein
MPVLRRCQIIVFLLAWFMATGAQWDLVQVFGWGSMIVNHSRDMTLISAVKKTFDGEMCSVCRAVKAAKQQENRTTVPNGKFEGKIVLGYQPAAEIILTVPDSLAWTHGEREPLSALRSAPPTPPPRV